MKDRGLLVEPVLTNNFDGLVKSCGVSEHPLFGFNDIYPKIDFTAKNLLVIGSHADRRKVREQARKQGVQIIFVDPEHYDGKPYLLEDAQDEDILIQCSANEFSHAVSKLLLAPEGTKTNC
jgi:hypothetical protein